MRVPFWFTNRVIRLVAALILVVGSAVLLSSSDEPVYTAMDKAYYADPSLVNFVRPGLVLKIVSANIAGDGTVRVQFKATDPRGLPLDIEGVTTPGPIRSSLRFTVAYIPQGETQYVAYTIRQQTSPITNVSATQASSDSAGTYEKVADGEYIYTLRTKVPTNFDRTVTHSVGMWGNRNLSEFDLQMTRNYHQDVYNWVPDGSPVTVTRDVVRTQTCNKCHDIMSFHDNRRTMDLCVLCHTPQTVDPDTGNTVDMPVMTHKIHMGANLPSVKAGGKYSIIGHNQVEHDYSDIHFPTNVNNCTICHEQTTGAAQADAWLKPSRAACGSCHDDVNFATGEGHVNLPQISDRQCGTCHQPEGELEFDASIKGAHTIARFSRDLPGTTFEIKDVTDGQAGKSPTVTFTVKDKQGNAFDISGMRLALVLAGPTSDYATYVSENAAVAQGPGDGTYFYTFKAKIPEEAKGTYAIGIEGYRSVTLLEGTKKQRTVRDAGVNKLHYFSVDGSAVQPRRQVVSLDKCNACHGNLSLHGDNRNMIEQCVICHNPNVTDQAVRPKDQMPAQTIQMAHMIHRIHTGAASDREYTVYGRGSVAYNFAEVHYPGDRRNCNACHVNGSEQPPLPENLLQVVSPRGVLNPIGPTAAACTGCHTNTFAASHALSNTTEQLGEACGACHAGNRQFAIPKMHAR